MPVRSKSDAETLRGLARSLYFSNDTIDWFLAEANAAQLLSLIHIFYGRGGFAA